VGARNPAEAKSARTQTHKNRPEMRDLALS
jgi:hypothetical protein